MQELSFNEIQEVSGGSPARAGVLAGIATGIGVGAFGSSWGAVGVGLAFAASPLTALALVGLAAWTGYELVSGA